MMSLFSVLVGDRFAKFGNGLVEDDEEDDSDDEEGTDLWPPEPPSKYSPFSLYVWGIMGHMRFN